jgi:AraC family transcriptional regulator
MASLVHPSVRERRTTSGSIPLVFEQVDFPAGESADAPSEAYVLCFVLQGCGEIRSAFDGRNAMQQRFRSGMFVPLTPPRVRAEFSMSETMQHLVVTLPPAIFDKWAHGSGNRLSERLLALQQRGFEDRLLAEIVRSAWLEAKACNPNGSIFADALRMALAGAIVRRVNGTAPSDNSARKLSRAQIASVRAYLINRIGDGITLADVAGYLGMGERTFSNAFKLATGRTPHQYLLGMRVDLAKDYLAHSRMTVLEIAAATGFVDQAHLTSVFRRHVGIPPARYRQSLSS